MRTLRVLPAVATLVAVALPASARAQARPDQALADSVREAIVAVLMELRDTTGAVRGQLTMFGRDLRQAGPETVTSRAAALSARCGGASTTLRRAEEHLRPTAEWPPAARAASSELTAAVRTLRETLRVECQVGLAPEGPGARADSLRAWGPYRTGVIERGITEFDRAVGRFARATGIRLEPRVP